MKDWKEKLLKEILTDYNMDSYRAHTRTNTINFIEQIISERDKEVVKILEEARRDQERGADFCNESYARKDSIGALYLEIRNKIEGLQTLNK